MTDALIIIDMQQGSFGPATPRHDAAGLVGRLNRLAGTVRADRRRGHLHPARRPAGRSRIIPIEPGWQLLDDLDVQPDDAIIHKKSCDAFLDTSLDGIPAPRARSTG